MTVTTTEVGWHMLVEGRRSTDVGCTCLISGKHVGKYINALRLEFVESVESQQS